MTKPTKTMKTCLTKILLLLPVFCLATDFSRLAEGVALAESRNDPSAVGDGGKARGAYQMWQIAWQQTSNERHKTGKKVYHFAYAHDAFVSREYAVDYLIWLERSLKARLGRPPTFWEIYAGYARGLGNFEDEGYAYRNLPARTKRAIGVIAKHIGEPIPR